MVYLKNLRDNNVNLLKFQHEDLTLQKYKNTIKLINMAFDRFKKRILDKSDMYNYYKDNHEVLTNELNEEIRKLKKDMEKLKKDNNKVKKDVEKLKKENKTLKKKEFEQRKINASNHLLFNRLFIDYSLESGGLIKAIHTLDIELLNITDTICKKYGFDYWIDYGNILGAHRHKGFIPWDDDVDVSMMRKDYNEFLDVLTDVINDSDHLQLSPARLNKPTEVMGFAQLTYNRDGIKMLAGIDYFVMDYISSPVENIEKVFKEQKDKFHINLIKSTGENNIEKSKEGQLTFLPGEIDVRKHVENSFDALNITYEKEDYIIPGIEGVLGGYVYPFILFKYEDIFPLKKITFEDNEYPCINNYINFIKTVYGEDYMSIPFKVHDHGRCDKLRYIENIEDIIEDGIIELRQFNSSI